MQKYQTIAASTVGLYRERGSKFTAYASPVPSVKSCEDILNQLRKDHPKARHFCYAYRLGEAGMVYRYSDDGEPSGTAGRPILARIDSYDLTFTMVAVVRYFGGKLLGAAGLLRAYRDAAEYALSQATIVEKLITRQFLLRSPYPLVGRIEESLGRLQISVTDRSFDDHALFAIELPLGDEDLLINSILSYALEIPSEQVGSCTELQGVAIKPYSEDSNFNDNEFMQ